MAIEQRKHPIRSLLEEETIERDKALSLRWLADQIGVPHVRVRRWVAGLEPIPLVYRARIARVFDVDIDYIPVRTQPRKKETQAA